MIERRDVIKINFLYCIGILIALAGLFSAVFSMNSVNDFAYAASSKPQVQEVNPIDALKYINMSQDGHRFTSDDFTKETDNGNNIFVTYSNKSVSISKGDSDTFYISSINKMGNDETVSNYKVNEYYYFGIDNSSDVSYIINLTCTKRFATDKGTTENTYNFTFKLIQTNMNFNKNNTIKWTYNIGEEPYILPTLTNDQEYETSLIELDVPYGSILNPIYVNFIYLGENYKISKYFYVDNDSKTHYVTNLISDILVKNDSSVSITEKIEELENSTEPNTNYIVKFNKSGFYNVQVYDKATTVNAFVKNKTEQSFGIKNVSINTMNPTGPFYVLALADNGQMIMNGQITNSNVRLYFKNITEVASKISKIEIIRSYKPSSDQNIQDTTTYSRISTIPEVINITDDGTYNIKVYNKQSVASYSYSFTTSKDIRSQFEYDGNVIKAQNEGISANEIKEISLYRAVESTYNGLNSSTAYKFIVTIAWSRPKISGIANNTSTANPVSLQVKGVGNIEVYATLNGKTLNLDQEIYQNGSSLPTFTEKGTYFIMITDQMGTVATSRFAITVRLNTASIILIVIGSVMAAFLLVFIIISRTKFKVR